MRFLTLVLSVCAVGCDSAVRAPEPPPGAHRSVVGVSGLPAPTILYPRHRILSPTPPIVIALPVGVGGLEIEILTPRCRRRIRSRDRVVPWPAEIPALRSGDAGWVRVTSALGPASSGFVRVRDPAYPARWLAGPGECVRGLSRGGLPMEALRLAAAECLPLDPGITGYGSRAGLPHWGAWRRVSLPGSIPADSPDP